MRKYLVPALLAVSVAGVASIADASAGRQSAPVNWHPQQAPTSGPVTGAEATLVRNDNGVRFRLSTRDLTPGNVYTLWLVVVNEPGACESNPCSGPDVLLNPASDAQVGYAAGHVAGGNGRGTFSGHVSEGPLDGWFENRALVDSHAAEIHLVVNDHGPKIASHMPGMLATYRGGCSDASPFPGIFPPSALADGEPGPNICRLFQSAIFTP